MFTDTTISIDAPPEKVWQVMTDVERWPEWTKSVTSVMKLDDGPLAKGSRVRIQQPKAPVAVWIVTEIEPGRFFQWETSSPAIQSIARHRIEPAGEGARVTLEVEQAGLFVAILAWWLKGLSRRYIDMEAAGLKARSEGSV